MTRSNTDWKISDLIAIIALESEGKKKTEQNVNESPEILYSKAIHLFLFGVVVAGFN